MDEKDLEVIKDVLSGKKYRYKEIVDRYSGLCLYFFKVRFRYDFETARDLTQEAFMEAFRCLNQFSGKSFKAWFMAICRNMAIDHSRRNKGSPELNFELQESDVSTQGFEGPWLRKKMIIDTLNTLPERQREIIEMRYFWDLKCTEIAQIQKIPEGTVKSDLHFARLRLIELLKGSENV